MQMLPKDLLRLMLPFAVLFSKRVWQHVLVLVVGAILAPGKRTVSAILRVMSLDQEPHFQTYHRVLNRAVWSSRKASAILLKQLVDGFAARGVIVMGMDDTIERRWGRRIAARGIYRDAVRSSQEHFVKTSGLRWLSLMLLVPIPWAQRVWALPFLTVLAPSERYDEQHQQRHKKLTDWARQMLIQVRRWLPHRNLMVVADSSFAALGFLASVSQMAQPVHVITRLRLDAGLYEPPPMRQPKQMGRPRVKGKRLPTLATVLTNASTDWQCITIANWYGNKPYTVECTSNTALWYHTGLSAVQVRWVLVRDPAGKFKPQAFLCTDLTTAPEQILTWFRQRWQLEVTFEEVRAHLGVETQRQWSDKAIARTTPALFALFSVVVLFAHELLPQEHWHLRQSAWYVKSRPCFVDALALVRCYLWAPRLFDRSEVDTKLIKLPSQVFACWLEALCYAA
jgi:hypothetical protein